MVTRSAVSVAELLAAWRDLQAGAYRGANGLPHPAAAPAVTPAGTPHPDLEAAELLASGGPVLLVAGTAGGVAASAVALALAEAGDARRLVDCAPTSLSELVEVCDRELGVAASGWHQGRRQALLVERNPDLLPTTPQQLAALDPIDGLSVIDAGRDALHLAHAPGWLGALARDPRIPLVVVSACSVPSLRRLAVALDVLAPAGRDVTVAITGTTARRWPRRIALPAAAARLRDAGRLTCIPPNPGLATRGLTAGPLPPALAAAARDLLRKEGRP